MNGEVIINRRTRYDDQRKTLPEIDGGFAANYHPAHGDGVPAALGHLDRSAAFQSSALSIHHQRSRYLPPLNRLLLF